MTSRFLYEAKTGLITLQGNKPTSISTRGSISHIRESQKAYVEGNIRQYSLLGSQNAISKSGNPIETRAQGVQTKFVKPETAAEGTPTTFVKPESVSTETKFKKTEEMIAKDIAKKVEEDLKKKELEQEEISRKAKEPAEKPPFDIDSPEGKQDFKNYVKYLSDKYTQKIAQIEIDKIYQESGAFSVAIRAINKMEKAIDRFNQNKTSKFAEWLNNEVSDLLGTAISEVSDFMKNIIKGVITTGTGGPGIIVGELTGRLIDEVKETIKSAARFKRDYVGNLQKLIDELFSIGGRSWESKYAKIKAEWTRKNKEIEETTQRMKKEAEAFLNSPEGREWKEWERTHTSGKDIMANSKKYDELKKKYKERIERAKEFIESGV